MQMNGMIDGEKWRSVGNSMVALPWQFHCTKLEWELSYKNQIITPANVATKGGWIKKVIEGLKLTISNWGVYKREFLLTKMVNKVNDEI